MARSHPYRTEFSIWSFRKWALLWENRLFAYAKTKTQISSWSAPLFSLHRRYNPSTSYIQNFKPLAIFYFCTARFVSELVGNPEDRFSHNEAQISVVISHEQLRDNTEYMYIAYAQRRLRQTNPSLYWPFEESDCPIHSSFGKALISLGRMQRPRQTN